LLNSFFFFLDSPTPDHDVDIEINLKTGYEAINYNEIASSEKLKPIELEMRKMENIMESVVGELEYMKAREEALRNTNGTFLFDHFLCLFYFILFYFISDKFNIF